MNMCACVPVRNVGELRSVVKTKIIVLSHNYGRHPAFIVCEPKKSPGNSARAMFICQKGVAIDQGTGESVVPGHPAETHGRVTLTSGNVAYTCRWRLRTMLWRKIGV